MEHAFECKLVERDNGIWMMDEEWFTERLQQCTNTSHVPQIAATY